MCASVHTTLVCSWDAWDAAVWGGKGAWDALVARVPEATVFQMEAWNRAWSTTIGAADDLRIVVVHDGRRLFGIAPLMVVRRRINGLRERVLRFIGTPDSASDYADFIIDPAREGETSSRMLDWILRHRGEWTYLSLTHVSPARAAGISQGLQSVAAVDSFMSEAPTTRLEPGPDAPGHRALLRKKSLQRHLAWFRRRGRLEFEVVDDLCVLRRHLPAFFDQHRRRRELAGDRSQFCESVQCQFYETIAETMFESGALHFSRVEFDGEVIAYHLGFVFRDRFYWYKPSFDVRWRKRSPGEVLIRCLFEDVIARGLHEFDFTVGEEAFKYRFANDARQIHQVHAHARIAGRMVARGRKHVGRLKRKLQSRLHHEHQ